MINSSFDEISNDGHKNNQIIQEEISHLRWSADGKEIIEVSIHYVQSQHMSPMSINGFFGKTTLSIVNDKLLVNLLGSYFVDGVRKEQDIAVRCVYQRKNLK